MTPQELSIGNLVRYNGEVVKIEQITKRKIAYHKEENESRMHYARLSEIEPIELTEEIVGKYFIHCGASYLRDMNRAEIYQTCKGWCLSLNNSTYSNYFGAIVNHIHELQNAYYLVTKKELTLIYEQSTH